MTEKLTTYDPAAALVDGEEIAFSMADALEIGNSAYIARARDAVARGHTLVKISDKKESLTGCNEYSSTHNGIEPDGVINRV